MKARNPAGINIPISCTKAIKSFSKTKVKWETILKDLESNELVNDPFTKNLIDLYRELPKNERALLLKEITLLAKEKKILKYNWINNDLEKWDAYAKVLDLIYTSKHQKIASWNIYTLSRKKVVNENVKLLAELISLKFKLKETYPLLKVKTSIHENIISKIKTLGSLLLPWELKKSGINITSIHQNIYRSHGFEYLHRYIYHTSGSAAAFKFWFTHTTNIKLFTITAVLMYYSEEIWDTYSEWKSFTYITLEDDKDIANAEESVANQKLTPQELLSSLEADLTHSSLSEDEKKDLNEIFDLLNEEISTELE